MLGLPKRRGCTYISNRGEAGDHEANQDYRSYRNVKDGDLIQLKRLRARIADTGRVFGVRFEELL